MTRESQRQQEQLERLMQIGGYLREVREDMGWTLEEVASRTLIQSRLLRAIEEGKIQQLPEPVYIQGFIRRYAEALGLDSSAIAEAFPTTTTIKQATPSWGVSPAQLRPVHLYIAYITLIVASVSWLSHLMNRSAPPTAPQINATLPAPANSPRPAASPAAKPSPNASSANRQPVQVDIKLRAQSWMEIESDGKVLLAEVLPEGTERTLTANSQLRIRAGNAGGVLVAYNGEEAKPLGAPGAVEERTFSASAASRPAANSATSSDTAPADSAQPSPAAR
ncbi:helix-turn-helix domain-containing protein [Leptolyngbya ohadii]|uniref:helix-turn-helix domain-containing protein n=1 Tax=Leptolyngbya ohadii TaxID=1962290 RepID=UPI000B5987CD|nr:RodZ domain-containing protein [Leptolyngbya ohadii]